MGNVAFVAGMLALAVLSGCGSDGNDAGKPSATRPATASTAAPDVASTYVPGDGELKTHVLHVTIRDVAGVEAYEATAQGCAPLNPVHTAALVVGGPTAESDSTPLTKVDLPANAEPSNGACEAKLTVTVPYAPRYTVGIAREGQGISTGDEPDPMWITTRGSSQKVTLVSQVVQTLR